MMRGNILKVELVGEGKDCDVYSVGDFLFEIRTDATPEDLIRMGETFLVWSKFVREVATIDK